MRRISRLVSVVVFAIALLAMAAPAYGASGQWERAWGKDVISPGPGDTGTGFEICTVAANCKNGLNTTKLGGEFDSPTDVATDATGNVYVVDAINHRVQKFDSNGSFLRLWGKDVVSAGPGNTGTGFEICVAGVDTCKIGVQGSLGGELSNPRGIAVDSQGNVYVGNTSNSRIEKYSSGGTFLIAWGKDVVSPGSPSDTGTGLEVCVAGVDTCKQGASSTGLGGEMTGAEGLAVDAANNVYVADHGNTHRIQKFSSNGNFLRLWGKDVVSAGPGNTGTGFEICVAGVDTCKNAAVSTGLGGELNQPSRVVVSGAGDVYVSDTTNGRVQKFDSNGNFLRLWGKDVVSAGPDETGTGAEICVAVVDTCKAAIGSSGLGGELAIPGGLAVDPAGNVYVSEFTGHRIQKFDSAGHFLRLWGQDVVSAGAGNIGTGFEICVATVDTCKNGSNSLPSLGGQMINPTGLGMDTAGNLYVADSGNMRIQKFTPDPPPATTITPGPSAFATATPSFQFSSSDTGSTFECSVDGGAFAACASPLTTTPLADGVHTLQVRAIDPARQVDATPDSRAFSVDTVAPDTQIDSGPAAGSTITDSTPSFGFSATEGGSTFQCRSDAEAFGACSGPGSAHTTAVLTDGQHTFQVRATDAVGNTDASPAARTFTVDTIAPDTLIDSGPAAGSTTADSTPSFGFSATEPGSSFQCRIDSDAFAACSGPGSAHTTATLGDGSHTFEVRGTDAVGNVDASPASRIFTVDTTGPETQIDSGPAANSTTADSSPTFGFSATEAGSTFECRVDGEPFAACTSEHTTASLTDGQHTFEVRATDAVGNVDASSASRSFTVDTVPDAVPDKTPPQTTIDQQPKDKLKAGKSATYAFSSSEPGSTFRCSIDGKAKTPCSSPLTINKPKKGKHTFEVAAVDAAGNVDASPATDTFKVKKKRKRRHHH
ncbi:MAG: large repetitive protein [Solirubrobacterales bacterium]|nr:large repetitive protein [Solirubrobacterales bacterium]